MSNFLATIFNRRRLVDMDTTNQPAAVKAFRILGTSDEVNECDLCGRVELKSTVALQPLDPDGGDIGQPVYYGCDCAARAAGWTQKDVRREAATADRAKDAAIHARREAIDRAVSADPEVRRTYAAFQMITNSSAYFLRPFTERKSDPVRLAWVAAEAAAKVRAEASL